MFAAKGNKWGYAWAARRDVFPLYDAAIIGGGDMLCAQAWAGKPCGLTPGPKWRSHYEQWAVNAYLKVQGNIGCVPGEIFHLDHGSHSKRQYNSRYQLVADLDPAIDIECNEQGLWRWADTERGRKYQAAVKGFFARRQDG